MKNQLWLTILIAFFVIGNFPLNGQQQIFSKVEVAENDVQDNVITFGGDILIKGKVKHSAIAFGGTITVEGEVGEVVLGIGADITLKSTAKIDGDVVSLGGTLHKMPGAIIDGDTVYFKASEGIGALLKEGFTGRLGGSLLPFLIILKIITAFIWLILAIILIAIFPRQVIFASGQIRNSFWPVFGTGILSLIIFAGMVIFSAFLSLVLIGIPIFLSLIIIGIIIKIFGQVILFYFFGESLSRGSQKEKPLSPLLVIVLGFILVTVIGLIPFLGPLFSLVLSLIGWGVVVRTKFGTTENWFKRQA